MNKVCLIRQPCGLGDIMICQKIAIKIYEKYNIPIIWPVIEEYNYLNSYLDNNIWFPSINSDFPFKDVYNSKAIIDNDNVLFLPLQDADQLINDKIFKCKYKMVNLKYDDWRSFVRLKRNFSKEHYLFNNILKLNKNEKYALVLRKYGALPDSKIHPFKYKTNLRIVEVDVLDNFTLFDWSTVIENAEEIYTIDTSIILLIELLSIKAKKIGYASRWNNGKDWSEVDYVLDVPFEKLYA